MQSEQSGYTIRVHKKTTKRSLKYKDTVLLTYTMEYPQFEAPKAGRFFNRLNRYYRQKAVDFEAYCRSELYQSAITLYEYSTKNGYPVRAFEAMLTYEVTYNRNSLLSLYFDQYEYTGGAHGNTIRTSDSWNLKRRNRVRLEELFSCAADYEAKVLKDITGQVELQAQSGTGVWFDHSDHLLEEYFDPDQFYLLPEGIAVYYQLYEIAPYSAGLPVFVMTLTPPMCG